MNEPRTAAGRALLDAANALDKQAPDGVPMSLVTFVRHAVPRIEAEERKAAAERADAALFALEQNPSHPGIRAAYRRAVMTAILGEPGVVIDFDLNEWPGAKS